jgi:RNA polymerase sigma factor (sigma-70 family)
MRRPLDPAAQARVEGSVALAYRLAWQCLRQHARDVPADELIAEALYGLTYAAALFDETRRVPFVAYATLVIRHRLIQFVRAWRRAAGRAGQYPDRGYADDAPWEAEDDNPAPDPVTGLAAREMCDRVRRVMPRKWYTVLRLYHAEGRTFQEIGRMFGVSRQRVQQVVVLATEQARQSFPEWAAAVEASKA